MTHSRRHLRPAFSLVELLTALGVILILIGLAVPNLRAALARAQQVGALSDLRGIGMTVDAYMQANEDHYPFVQTGLDRPFVFPPGTNYGTLATDNPWASSYAWPTAMHEVAPWSEHYSTWLNPGARNSDLALWRLENGRLPIWPSYSYSNSFIASSRVWTSGATPTLTDISPRRGAEVAAPSSKVLMFDSDPSWHRPRHPNAADDSRCVLTADGAAAVRSDADATAPFPNPLRADIAWRYHDTPRGLLGHDF